MGMSERKNNGVLPAGCCPEGVAVERLSAQQRRLVEVALPGQGQAVLAHLLSYATCMPHQTLVGCWTRFIEDEERKDTAHVVVWSLKALANSEGAPCGPDRYYQLVLVLEALQVLKRQVHRRREVPHDYVTIFHIDLSAPSPCLPTLIGSCSQVEQAYANPKVKRLLAQVRARLHTLTEREAAPEASQVEDLMGRLVQQYRQQGRPQASLLALVHQMLVSILSTETVKEERDHLEAEIMVGLEQPCAITDKKLPETGKKLKQSFSHVVMPSYSQCVEFSPLEDTFLPQKNAKQPDDGKKQEGPEQKPAHHAHTATTMTAIQMLESADEDLLHTQMSTFLPPEGKKQEAAVSFSESSFSEKKRQQERTLIDNGVAGYHDPRAIEEIQREAGMYARLFDGQNRWMGKLVTCVRSYPPALRRLAAIDTLYHLYEPDWRGRPKSPGAWFCRTCERFAGGKVEVPEIVRRWAATELDYDTIAAALQSGQRVPGPHDLAPLPAGSGGWKALSDEPAQRPALENSPSISQPVPAFRARMDRARAKRLAARMMQEVASDPMSAQVQVLEGRSLGTWMVLFIWEDGVEVPIENETEWDDYWRGVQECQALPIPFTHS